jgi:hydrogenase expression/formation protein HypC
MCLGVPGKIVEIYQKEGLSMAKVDFSGVTREACIEHVPEAEVGDYAIIHVGFAISLLSEEEALETMDLLREIMEAGEQAGEELTR